jgi:hypothetical protein
MTNNILLLQTVLLFLLAISSVMDEETGKMGRRLFPSEPCHDDWGHGDIEGDG